MFQEERLYKILELLRTHDRLTTNQLVDIFGVSRDTARRDIVKLSNEGSVLRTHGGITLPKEPHFTQFYKLRVNDNVEQKQKIGKKASTLIKSGQICFFDASTTVLHLCSYAPTSIEVFSNSLNNVEILDQRKCNVHVIGGQLNHDNRFIYGYESIEQILSVHYDIAFLGTDSITEDGFFTCDKSDISIKKSVAKVADKIYILTESSKFERIHHPYKCFDLQTVDGIITDKYPNDNLRQAIEKQGVEIILAR